MTIRPDLDELRHCLQRASREARCEVIGADSLTNPGEIAATTTFLRAFGDDATGFIYCKPTPAKSLSLRMPDILLGFRTIGLICVEVKGHSIDGIHRVANGHLWVTYRGKVKEESVFSQIEQAMYNVKGVVTAELRDKDIYLDYLVLLPFISREQWDGKRLDATLFGVRCFLKDPLATPKNFRQTLESNFQACPGWSARKPTADTLRSVRRAFGDSYLLHGTRNREKPETPFSLAQKIYDHAVSDKRLSDEQQELGRKNFDWHPQLIRGVAGSGKTKILATNAAYYLLRRQEEGTLFDKQAQSRLAVVCFNQALVPLIRSDIERAYENIANKPLDPSPLHVSHFNALLYSLSSKNQGPLTYYPVRSAADDARADSYLEQLSRIPTSKLEPFLFDTVFVDEAQDLHPQEIALLVRLCRKHGDAKDPNIIIFYDDAQNVYGRRRPTWSDLGINVPGGRTRLMQRCYRNTREIIEFGFNVLLGTGAPSDMRVRMREFADVGSLKDKRIDNLPLVEECDDRWVVRFAQLSDPDEPPTVKDFPSRQEELVWLRRELRQLIEEEKVEPQDIAVIGDTHEVCKLVSESLSRVSSRVQGVFEPHRLGQHEKSLQPVTQPGMLTVTTTKTFKGHETYVGFVVCADGFKADTQGRASFYVACTRAKLRLYVSGVKQASHSLLTESQKVATLLATPAT
jgi:superfamily I DNA and RNA helicase